MEHNYIQLDLHIASARADSFLEYLYGVRPLV